MTDEELPESIINQLSSIMRHHIKKLLDSAGLLHVTWQDQNWM